MLVPIDPTRTYIRLSDGKRFKETVRQYSVSYMLWATLRSDDYEHATVRVYDNQAVALYINHSNHTTTEFNVTHD